MNGPGIEVGPLVDGVLRRSESEHKVIVTNPSTGQRLYAAPIGCDSDADSAVQAARRSFEDGRWSDAPPSFRGKILRRLSELMEAESSFLDALDAEEMGKPVSEVFCNAASAAALMRFYGEAVDKVTGEVYTSDTPTLAVQRLAPRGVVAAIVPWNFPTFNTILKIAPALAGGNCVVLKPSELSSRSAIRIGQLALQAGIPSGVLNVVPGIGQTVGRALGMHHDVDMMTFTGSSAVGKMMLEYAGRSNMKVVMAECGGKSPQIVFDDGVDLDAAAQSIARLLVTNQGQICSVGSRLLVQRSIQDVVVQKILEQLTKVVMGDASDPKTTYGPIVSAKQQERVLNYIEIGSAQGAKRVYGGKRKLAETGGFFVEPTVFTDVLPGARIAQEEIFGPVLSVIPFEDGAEAIRIANGTAYGLVAYVWTNNFSTAMRVAKGVRSSVIVNGAAPRGEGSGHAFSHEPIGASGVGTEHGLAGMQSYMRRHLICFNHA